MTACFTMIPNVKIAIKNIIAGTMSKQRVRVLIFIPDSLAEIAPLILFYFALSFVLGKAVNGLFHMLFSLNSSCFALFRQGYFADSEPV